MKDEILVPDLQLKLKGVPPSVVKSLHADLVEVSVQQQLGLTTDFSLKFYTWDTQKVRYGWVDESTLKLGREIEIRMGYVNQLERVMVGEVTDLELPFHADEPPMLTVRGQSKAHRLSRGDHTVVYHKKTDFEIARAIASRNQLRIDGDQTPIRYPYVLQATITDLAFLNERAEIAGASVNCDDGILRFELVNKPPPAPRVLKAGLELISFTPRITSKGRVGAVKVIGISDDAKPLIHKETVKPNKPGTLNGDELYRGQVTVIQARELHTLEEVKARAEQEVERLRRSFVSASGTCIGIPTLRPGQVVDVMNVGERFSGKYRLNSVTHSFSTTQGYRSSFDATGEG